MLPLLIGLTDICTRANVRLLHVRSFVEGAKVKRNGGR